MATETYDPGNVFAKILRKEIPADIVFEDDQCLAFRDLSPQAPEHVLVIPKAPLAKLADATPEQEALLGHLLWACGEVARMLRLDDGGFRVVINNGAGANQTVFHLHLHVLGGRNFQWPPG